MITSTILQALAKITPEQITQSSFNTGPPQKGETVLCVIEGDFARQLWALAREYDRQRDLAEHSYRYDQHSDTGREHLLRLGQRLEALAKVTRSLAWIEMRDEAGPSAWEGTIGLRAGFTLVTCAEEEDEIQATLLGSFPNLEALVKSVQENIRAHKAPIEPSGKKRKPQ